MVAALEMYFDNDATRRVASLWRALEAEGVPALNTFLSGRHRPHVSLAAARTFDPDAVVAALDGLVVGTGLSLSLDFVGQFVGRVLWLGVVPTAEPLRRSGAGGPVRPLRGAWVACG